MVKQIFFNRLSSQSPLAAMLYEQHKVKHANDKCGNGNSERDIAI